MKKVVWMIAYHMSWAWFVTIAVTGMTLYAVSEKDVFFSCPEYSLPLGLVAALCVVIFCKAGKRLDDMRVKKWKMKRSKDVSG
jgi:hypothetical protein